MLVRIAVGLAVLLSFACGPTPAQPSPRLQGADASRVQKTITIAQLNTIKSYGPWEFSSTAGGGASLAEIHTVGLTSEDRAGNFEARLAERLPSLDNGTMVVLPDGRMQTTWTLRSDVRWHDGVPFTAEDVVFSWEVAREPELASSITTTYREIESVEATSPTTVVFTWKTTSYRAVDLSHRNLWPFPKHLLEEAFAGDKQAFLASPYFTTSYVNLGPFRLV